MDGSHTPPPERTLITEKMGSIYIAKRQPKAIPKIVPKIPVKAPHIINIRIIEPRDSPIVRNIPISLPLFLTNMIKPDIIFILAIITKIDMRTNITLSSISRARKKLLEASLQVHN